MLVERDVYDEAVETAGHVAETTKVGLGATWKATTSARWSARRSSTRSRTLIQKGIDEGARLVAGGPGRPEGINRGYFVRPTVFADVTNDMTIAREEIFGPVLSIIPFDTEDEAVRIANDTPYGLTNYVQTQDGAEAQPHGARACGRAWCEMNGKSRGAGAPFGGMKASGNGREGGIWGLEEFCEVKAVSGWAAE